MSYAQVSIIYPVTNKTEMHLFVFFITISEFSTDFIYSVHPLVNNCNDCYNIGAQLAISLVERH